MATRIRSLKDVPEGKGKQVLMRILNSPRADMEKLRKIAEEYENWIVEERRREEAERQKK